MKKFNNTIGLLCILVAFVAGISTEIRTDHLQETVAFSYALFLLGIGFLIKAKNPW